MDQIKILILGGDGFIGKHLINFFSKNKKIKIFSTSYRKQKKIKKKNIKIFNVKNNNYFLNKKSLIYKENYNFIINSHGYISNNDFTKDGNIVFQQHISNIINILYNIKKNSKTTLINLGSSHEYMVKETKISEEDGVNPISFYGCCKGFLSTLPKFFNESDLNINLVHLRLFQIYGEGQSAPRLIPYLINSRLNEKKVILDSAFSKRDFLHIDDLVKLIKKIIFIKDKSKLDIFNVGSGNIFRIIDIDNKLNELFPKKPITKIKIKKENNLTLIPDLRKIEKNLDWKSSVTIDEGLVRSLLYEKAKKKSKSEFKDYKYPSKISIIMNCFNGEKYLDQAIDCVINQTYQNWELIFWDNNSTDNSSSIIKSYKDSRIKYYKSSKKISLASARNKALDKIKGSYVAFLDVDDYWTNNKLISQIKNMVKNNTKASYTNFFVKRDFIPTLTKYKDKNLNSGFVYKNFIDSYDVGFLTFMISADIIKKNKIKFNTKFEIISDFEFVMKICKKFKLSVCDETLGVYRFHNESYSSKNVNKHIIELREWIKKEQIKETKNNKISYSSINKKIKLLEYKNFIKDKNNHKTKEFKMISSKDKLKTRIKHLIGY